MKNEIIFFDIETTGLDKKNDSIIQFAAKKYDKESGKRTDEICLYINNKVTLPAIITELTGITQEKIESEGISPRDAVRQAVKFLGKAPVLGGHNIDRFDIPFLENYFARYRTAVSTAGTMDTLSLSRKFLSQSPRLVRRNKRGERSMKLGDLVEQLGIADGLSFHNALDDVEASIRLYEYIETLKKSIGIAA